MMLRVYYDEIDGDLDPQRVLIKPNIEYSLSRHNIQAPFERIYVEDFHDELKVLTVSQAALTRDLFDENVFNININQVKYELSSNGLHPDHVYDADYFILLMADLEETLKIDVKNLLRGD